MQIGGIILAGGQGLRMGGADKALLPFRGAPLIAQVMARLSPQVAALAISANGDPSRFGFTGLQVLPDAVPMGPLSGVLAGLDWAAAQGLTLLVTAPCDAPFLPCDLVPRLLLAAESAPGAPVLSCDETGRIHATHALWPVTLAPALAAFLASGAKPRVQDFAAAHGAVSASFPAAEFVNLNTPQALARAEAQA